MWIFKLVVVSQTCWLIPAPVYFSSHTFSSFSDLQRADTLSLCSYWCYFVLVMKQAGPCWVDVCHCYIDVGTDPWGLQPSSPLKAINLWPTVLSTVPCISLLTHTRWARFKYAAGDTEKDNFPSTRWNLHNLRSKMGIYILFKASVDYSFSLFLCARFGVQLLHESF